MDCSEFLTRYSDYDDSLVPPTEADRFRAHMDRCPVCARYDRVLRKGRMLARQVPRVEPSPDFVPRLRARLWRESHRTRSIRPAIGLVPAVAALLVAVGAFSALGLAAYAESTSVQRVRGRALLAVAQLAPDAAPRTADRLPHVPAIHRAPSRLPHLPADRAASPRAWTAVRVDPAVAASYSPLITGMPAYRGARPRSSATIP